MSASVSAFDNKEHESIVASLFKFAFVLGLHGAIAAWVLGAQSSTPSEPVPVRMNVRSIEISAKETQQERPAPIVRQPKQLPQAAAQPVVRRSAPATPPAMPTASTTVSTTASTTAEQAPTSVAVASSQSAPAKEETPPASAPAAVTAARFDADYLKNPAPVYPPLSRKLHEEGKVLLLVQVSANGDAENVQIKQGSGYLRLDEAATNAVRKWRFVPARRGSEPVASSVVVPLVFRLDT